MRRLLPITSAAAVFAAAALTAGDWTQFRGPNGAGVSPSRGVPEHFDAPTNLVWRTPLPQGHSSPVFASDRIVCIRVRGPDAAHYLSRSQYGQGAVAPRSAAATYTPHRRRRVKRASPGASPSPHRYASGTTLATPRPGGQTRAACMERRRASGSRWSWGLRSHGSAGGSFALARRTGGVYSGPSGTTARATGTPTVVQNGYINVIPTLGATRGISSWREPNPRLRSLAEYVQGGP